MSGLYPATVWYLPKMKSLAKALAGFVAFIGLVALSGFVVRRRFPAYGSSDDARVRITAALDGVEFASTAHQLTDLSALAYFGGIELDLTAATPAPGASIHLRALFGGIDVIVPDAWRVEVVTGGGMSGIENLTNPDVPSDAPLVVIDAWAVMGGIEIHERGGSDGS